MGIRGERLNKESPLFRSLKIWFLALIFLRFDRICETGQVSLLSALISTYHLFRQRRERERTKEGRKGLGANRIKSFFFKLGILVLHIILLYT